MSNKYNNYDNDFSDVSDIEEILKEFDLDLPDEDDAFFEIEQETLEEYLENYKIKLDKVKK